jgi:general secretion pathway protein D
MGFFALPPMTMPPLKALVAGTILLLAAAPPINAQEARAGRHDPSQTASENSAIRRKLASIVIPRLEFHATTLENAIEFLRQESRRLDTDPDVAARGVNILLQLPPAAAATVPQNAVSITPDTNIPGLPAAVPAVSAAAANPRITLTLNRIPLLEALQYIALQAGLKLRVEPYAVSLVPLTGNTDAMVTAVFRVPPSFISNAHDAVGGATDLDQPASAAR